jgi:hypothetical protein
MNETTNDTNPNPSQWADHLEERNEVIKAYGSLWRQAIAKSGVTDKKLTENLLQVCAACYLDGVHQGSRLTIDGIVGKQQK